MRTSTTPHHFPQLKVANSFWRRFAGLMLTARLPKDRGLLLTRCPSVHTCFMRYALDLVYLDPQGTVVKLVADLQPWRFSRGGKGAAHVLELAAGGIAHFGIQIGDRLDQCLSATSNCGGQA
ncbi:DUF192 domain-containing protein [Herbaspirillum sp. HC18]|nr:DUF192 domain-containing protein [Herbaspirillum sp. HC18]